LWWPSLTEDMQTEQLLYWSGMTDTEHKTSGLNEEDKLEVGLLRLSDLLQIFIDLIFIIFKLKVI